MSKMSNFRRFLVILLAFTLVFTGSVPAFGMTESENENGSEGAFKGSFLFEDEEPDEEENVNSYVYEIVGEDKSERTSNQKTYALSSTIQSAEGITNTQYMNICPSKSIMAVVVIFSGAGGISEAICYAA